MNYEYISPARIISEWEKGESLNNKKVPSNKKTSSKNIRNRIYPKKMLVQKKLVSSKPFELTTQAVQFSNGTIIVGYDVWRCLQHDCSSDPNPRWYNNMESLEKDYAIRTIS